MLAEGLNTWRTILTNHESTRDAQVFNLFHKGIKALDIRSDQLPNLNEVNRRLMALTGFKGKFVSGLEDGGNFFAMLSRREFPIGNFIRAPEDLTYTPEPDLVHDLYGHLPFFADLAYADFCQKLAAQACRFKNRPDLLRQFERFFWFTIEFGLIKTEAGIRVFGAGIASSLGECKYALSEAPEVIPFNVETIRQREFRIDQMQTHLFLLDNVEQLYSSLPELLSKVAKDL